MASNIPLSKGHEGEGLWPLHFKHSHWWKRKSWSKFASHCTWGSNRVSERKIDVKATWISMWRQTFLSLRATRPRACDCCTSSTLVGGKAGAGPSSFHLRDQHSKWMQDGCKVYTDSYMASNESCFVIPWNIFYLLKLGLTQNQDNMTLQNLTTVYIFMFCHVWRPPHE